MKKPMTATTTATSSNNQRQYNKLKAPPKKAICLGYLYRRSLVELEAFDLYGETCLHSTISTLANTHGLKFKRRREAHQHRHGGTTHFTRYTLAEESRRQAAALLKHYGLDLAA